MRNSTRYTFLVSLIVSLGGFLMGFDASVISGVVRFIEPEFNLSKIELGWAVSSLTLTATLAMMFAGPLSDKYGRKSMLLLAAVFYTVSAITSAFAPTFTLLVIARMIGGLGIGASLIIVPMYIAETAPAKSRGKMVSINQLNIVIGISVAFFTNFLILKLGNSGSELAKYLMIAEFNWRWMLGIEAIPALFYFFALFYIPKSPRWLVLKGKKDEAFSTLIKTEGDEEASVDIIEIENSIQAEKIGKKAILRDVFKPALKNVLLIGVVLAILQQISGINSVFFYAPIIFEKAGLGTDAAFTQAIFVGLVNLVFTIIAMSLIDKLGRKPLLVIGMVGIAISMFLLAYGFGSATFTLSEKSVNELTISIEKQKLNSLINMRFSSEAEFKEALKNTLGKKDANLYENEFIKSAININTTLILLAILGFVASYAVSIGPVMWVMFSELFPNTVRAVAISFVGFINSLISFLVQLVFPLELEKIGSASTFLIYGLFAAAGLIFVLLKVPETKGKSLEELEKILIN